MQQNCKYSSVLKISVPAGGGMIEEESRCVHFKGKIALIYTKNPYSFHCQLFGMA